MRSPYDSDKYNITKEKVLEMLYEDRALAHKEGKINAAISVAKLIGDSIGMFKTNNNQNVFNVVQSFSENDKQALKILGIDPDSVERNAKESGEAK
jgi:hypothetical protein